MHNYCRLMRFTGSWVQIVLLVVVVGFLPKNRSFADENEILALVDSIRIKGNRRIEKDAIMAVLGTKEGDKFDLGGLDKDLRYIYGMGYFEDVQVESNEGPGGYIVTFIVTEKPSIGKIVFEGHSGMKEDDLKEEVGIKLYSILDRNEIKQSVNKLKEYYRNKGYYHVEIKESTELIPNNEVLLKYEIEEHEKTNITKIRFLGNVKFDDDDLKDIMETSEKGFFSWITESGRLDDRKLEFDIHKITSFYHNNGFIRAKVGHPVVVFGEDKGLSITIEIDEGPQYGVKGVFIEGDLIKPVDELLEKVRIGKEDVFNREVVRQDASTIRNIYADEGYAYCEITPETKEDEASNKIDITYRISKGAKVRFERISISGNTQTRDKVIRRELKVVEGEYFGGQDMNRSEQNLNRLGFFEKVEVQTKKGKEEDLMALNIRVKERPTGSFTFGAGYSSVDKLVGMLQISQNNLFGRGQRLAMALNIGGSSNQIDLTFAEPWLWDRPVSGEIRGYKWETEYDEYDRDSTGGELSVGFPMELFDDFTRGWVKYGYDDSDISEVDTDAAYVIREMEGRSVTSSMVFGLKRDSTVRAWNPSRGSIHSVSFEYAGGILGGDNYFNKYSARSAWYFPLWWDTVFLVQGRWGYLRKRSGGELPVYEKFYLGGINTLRGYDYEDVSPVDPDTGDKIGGEKMMVYNLEYRFPLVAEQGIIGLLFFDAGNVFASDEDFTFRGIRPTAGLGVRWYSPMGPLRLEWGRVLDPREGDPSGNFEFTVGTMF